MAPILQVENLSTVFRSGFIIKREFTAVKDVSLSVNRGKTLGIIGKSGSGKTTLGLSILRLIEPTAGKVFFDNENILLKPGSRLKLLRKRMQIIFQNPESSLDPRMSIKDNIAVPLKVFTSLRKKKLEYEIMRLCEQVMLPKETLDRYPHQVSGGQIQRALIARVLATGPDFIVADEPTSMLDLSVQAQILNLLRKLQEELHISYLFISHDPEVVRWMGHDTAIMREGSLFFD